MIKEIVLNGRKYLADVSPDEQEGAFVIIGPPDGLVDDLGLPEPFATNLHNVLYNRRVFTYRDVSKPGVAQGAIQEVLDIDVQRLAEAFANIERESP